MPDFGIVGLLILLATFFASYQGFKNPDYFERYLFRVSDIRYGRQYYRLFTSGFLHTGWWHLLLNALTFYYFSSVEYVVGFGNFLLIYVVSLVGGNLFSLFLHRNDSDYLAVGASGAISGLVFASIALYPGMSLGLLGIIMPGWLYGMLYVVVSAVGITTRRDNIGHDAHLAGGLVGLLTVVAMRPELLRTNYVALAAILVPALGFFYLLFKKPEGLILGNFFSSEPAYQTVDDRYKIQQKRREDDLDYLLDKINKKGLDSLSDREKQQLERLSR
ncbi:MAG TPA: rhomboid family intramembrane serine protease [Hymenobacter sp.]|uniref:rhomboid family intramembrane serine protease n=1 Tax=Hymenobacter sp. TaxID=1898978 RepID=UPI002D7EEEDC|nr:rhomboid family intramembrane serine protease [Hymenobacter sp.]HET9503880.1 rhomboid family intramembrane serine protease [Hymenobacter sp.]